MPRSRLALPALAFALAIAGTPARASSDLDAGLRGLAAADSLAASIGFRLASANASRCDRQRKAIGVLLQDVRQYPANIRPDVRRVLGLAGDIALSVVVEGGPADSAGIPPGSALLAIDGRPVAGLGETAAPGEQGFERLQLAEAALDESAADGTTQLTLRLPDGSETDFDVDAVPICAAHFRVTPSTEDHARTDDQAIEITTGLFAEMRSDGELAAVLAHELAHYVLHHFEEQQALGSARKLMRRHEEEADRLSVRLMLDAGYDPQDAVSLWTHFAALQHSFLALGYHGSRKDRRERIRDEINRAKQ